MCRTGREEDAGALYRLVCELEEKPLDQNGFYEIYRSQLESPGYRCWVWEEDGLVAGMLDIDSPVPARFDEEDLAGLEQFVRVLERAL